MLLRLLNGTSQRRRRRRRRPRSNSWSAQVGNHVAVAALVAVGCGAKARRLRLRQKLLKHATHSDAVCVAARLFARGEISEAELTSYVACRWLDPAKRLRAVRCRSTYARLVLCTEALHERSGRMQARLAVQRALA